MRSLTSSGGGGLKTYLGPSWPNAGNTGYGNTPLTPAGSNNLSTPGTYSGLIFTGVVTISASNVLLKNCLIVGIPSDPWHLGVNSGLTGVVIQNVTIDGIGAGTTTGGAVYGIFITGNSQVSILACDISKTGHCIAINDGQILIKDNFMHAMVSDPSSHYETIYYGGSGTGGFSLDIEHNTCDASDQVQTAGIYIENFFGAVQNVTINNNLVIAPTGDLAIQIEGNQNPNNMTGITVSNNAEVAGAFGYNLYDQGLAPVFQVTHFGNYDYYTKAPVT
jgi:hypothetical protein